MAATRTPWWAWTWPVLAWVVLLAAAVLGTGGLIAAIASIALIATVFAAVYHAEVVAHHTGEPFGTLVLALAVTVIETALIVSVMVSAPVESAGLARDTVFAAVMIVCNGIVGACLLAGGARHREQVFQLQGANAALAVLAALTVLTLILPNVASPGPTFSTPQLAFEAIVSLALYGSFVFVQTVRHRDYFLPVGNGGEEVHASPPSNRTAILSASLLVLALAAVVGLAKALTPTVELGVARAGRPISSVASVPDSIRPTCVDGTEAISLALSS
jgi:Ca2+:H+ antiporter